MAIVQPSNFHGYDSSNLTKGVEQRQHAAQATAGDFLFDLDKLRQTHQKSYFYKQWKQIQTDIMINDWAIQVRN